jgi:hypothetical protein
MQKRALQGRKEIEGQQTLQAQPAKKWLVTGRFFAGILASATVVGGVAAAFFFLPRVTVDPSGPYDPSNPSPITFTIANINIIPLRDVQPSLGVCFMDWSTEIKTHPSCNGPSESRLNFAPWFVKWLDIDEKYQIAIEDLLKPAAGAQAINANITIGVTYTPWRMPSFWRITKEFRFVTKKRSDGKIYWIPTPLNR